VQEIGRAGRDGKLARCHMFLNNEDFFLIRRLILSDLLDHYNALKLTNKVIVESKRQLLKIIRPDLAPSKKRKMPKAAKNDEEEYVHKLIDEFENESDLAKFYTREESKSQKILFD
jgi:superfamily II DNA helicase RecQ